MSQQSGDDVSLYKYPAVTPLGVSLFNRVSRNEQQPLPLWCATLAAPRGGLSSRPAAPAHILNTLVAFLETPALWRRDYDMETAQGLLSGGGAQGSPLLSASTLLGFVARVNIEAYIKSPARTHALVTAAPQPSWMPAGRDYRVVEWC